MDFLTTLGLDVEIAVRPTHKPRGEVFARELTEHRCAGTRPFAQNAPKRTGPPSQVRRLRESQDHPPLMYIYLYDTEWMLGRNNVFLRNLWRLRIINRHSYKVFSLRLWKRLNIPVI